MDQKTTANAVKALLKTKTFWTGVAGLATATGAAAAGEMSIAQAVQTAITCLIGIFLRSGMIKA
ncbi:MAG: hypothetical protein HZB23_08905 [Deltaproteobacteria bacterium]|nr:hypothetical protein [Deltaproteobacteria bacterium]